MIVLKRNKKYIIIYLICFLFFIGMSIYGLFFIVNLSKNIIFKTIFAVLSLVYLIIFFVDYTPKQVKKGTLTFMKFDNEGFKVIKPFSVNHFFWDNIKQVEYINGFKPNELNIKIVYIEELDRKKGDICIYYRDNINKYIKEYCAEKIIEKTKDI